MQVAFRYIIFADYYDDYDECSHQDANLYTGGENCAHDEFFSSETIKPIKELEHLKKSKIRFCCNDHGYVFTDPCPVTSHFMFCMYCSNNITSTFRYDSIRCFCFKQSRNTHEQRVCAKASLDDIVGQSDVLKCPDHCLAYRQITLNARDFMNGSNDDLLMNKTMHPNVKVSIVTTEVTRAGKMLFERKYNFRCM